MGELFVGLLAFAIASVVTLVCLALLVCAGVKVSRKYRNAFS